MKLMIAVDANAIIAALIGGVSREIFFNKRLSFVSTEFTANEIRKYLPLISKKSGVEEKNILFALSLLPITFYSKDEYEHKMMNARKLIGHIDEKDTDILALSLAFQIPIWSDDKHFEKVKGLRLIKTRELM